MRQFGRLMWPTIGVAFVEVQKLLAEMIKSQELMLEIRWDFGGESVVSREVGWIYPLKLNGSPPEKWPKKPNKKGLSSKHYLI